MKALIKVCKNGTKIWEEEVKCDRCGGLGGSDAWKYTGITCYKCNGTGKMTIRTLEYTPEHEAELLAKRQKKAEKRAKEFEEMRKQEEARQAEIKRITEEKRKAEAAQKAISQYVGEIGKKITVDIVENKTVSFETFYGIKNVHIMKDSDGNCYKWFTEKGLGYDVLVEDGKNYYMEDEKGRKWDWHSIEQDEQFTITGTIKEHSEYNGEKQNVLTRCKIRA